MIFLLCVSRLRCVIYARPPPRSPLFFVSWFITTLQNTSFFELIIAVASCIRSGIHLSAWYYGKGTGNGGRAKIFLNGVEATCNYSGTIPATLYQTTTNLLVNRFNPSTYGDCNMQFLRMHNRALTLQEIRQMYVDQYNRINQQQ